MKTIIPFFWYKNNAREAAEFYVSIFSALGGKKSKITAVTHYDEESSKAAGMPAGSVMTVSFVLNGQEFIALNGGAPPGENFSPTLAISFLVNCDTQKEIDWLWEKLSEGGKTFPCGWLTDKYSIPWQIAPTVLGKMLQDKNPAKAKRVMAAMLKMVKIDIDELKKTYRS